MKDNISLIAAAAGGFMLSVALAGILRGTPLTSWQSSSIELTLVANQQLTSVHSDKQNFR